jgi:nucleoside transporter
MSPTTLRLGIMMFIQFFVWGAWYVSAGPYMSANNMAGMIPWAYTVGPIAAVISPLFLGLIADRYFASERVLGTMHFLGALALIAAPFAAQQSPTLFIVMLFLHMLCYMPTLGLTNTLALHNMQVPEKEFPIVRVFGTIGWIAANWAVSLAGADKTAGQFYIAGGAGIALLLYSFALPHTPPPLKGKQASIGSLLGFDALGLLRYPSFAVFVIASFLVCIPLAAYYNYGGVYVGKVGFEKIAGTMSFGQVSEIVFMLLMPMFFARLGVKWMLLSGMLAWAVRYGLFSAADENNVKWMVFLGILLHGICYDFFFVTGFIYTDKRASKEIRGQAQGLLVLITQGLGLGLGAQIMGRIVAAYTTKAPDGAEVVDWGAVWLIPAIAAAVIMVAFGLLFRDDSGATEEAAEGKAVH